MKIALNIEWIGARRGGAEKYAGTVARALIDAGHEVHLFARGVDSDEVPSGTPIHEIRISEVPGLGWSRAYRFAAASARALARESFDLIVGFNKTWYQDVYLAVAGAHPAAVECGLHRFRGALRKAWHRLGKRLSLKQRLFQRIERRQFGPGARPQHIVAPSRFSAAHFRDLHGVPERRISVIYNGVDRRASDLDAAAARREFRRRHGFADDQTVLLFTARNYALKGLEPLIEAFAFAAASRPRAVLAVCGSRRDGAFRRQAARSGIADRVRFLGFVDDVRAAFAGADAFVFPTFYDPCSLVVPEAMSAGLPVVTTRTNGAAELITPGVDGFLVDDAWDIEAWAAQLATLCDDAELRVRTGAAARRTAKSCTMQRRTAELTAVIEQLCAQRDGRPPPPAQAA
mgnify:CR=1 FL=1